MACARRWSMTLGPRRRRAGLLLPLAIATAVAMGGCGKQNGAEEAHPAAGGTEQAITVDAHDMAFRPQTITVEPHGELVVTVENRGRLRHSFTIDDLDVDLDLEAGKSGSVRVPADAPLTFLCRYHAVSGMRGSVCPRTGDCASPR